jgi:hypothetical protein
MDDQGIFIQFPLLSAHIYWVSVIQNDKADKSQNTPTEALAFLKGENAPFLSYHCRKHTCNFITHVFFLLLSAQSWERSLASSVERSMRQPRAETTWVAMRQGNGA